MATDSNDSAWLAHAIIDQANAHCCHDAPVQLSWESYITDFDHHDPLNTV